MPRPRSARSSRSSRRSRSARAPDRALRKLGRTPVLLVSGYAADAAAQQLLDSGADGFLEKPYTAEQLGGEIDRILGRA